MEMKSSTEVEGLHSWVLPLFFRKDTSKHHGFCQHLFFFQSHSCGANEVKSDLPAPSLALYLVTVLHAERLAACAVLEIRSLNP